MLTPMAKEAKDHMVRISDKLWRQIQRAALREGAKRGEPVSASEWLRDAAARKLEERK